MKEIWLTTAYLGPVEYYQHLISADVANIEAMENYEKQSWRNRIRILSANGPMELSIPIVKGHTPNQPVREVKIDYSESWQKVHYRSVESAYRHSPFYEYLIDEIKVLWEIRMNYLFDYNMLAMDIILRLLKAGTSVRLTEAYQKPGFYGENDFRYSIHPKLKKQGTEFIPVPYHQVFSDRFGFVQDLSVVDWLFNDFRI